MPLIIELPDDIIIDSMNQKHRRTLRAIYEDPVRANIPWRDIENMLRAAGAEISEGRGSRIRIVVNGMPAFFHRPHPQRETDKGAVRAMRRFLISAELRP